MRFHASTLFAIAAVAVGCRGPVAADVVEPDYTVRPGVEIATILDATSGDSLTLYGPNGDRLLTLIADDFGQAHFAYVPDEHITIDTRNGAQVPIVDGHVLKQGAGYEIVNDATGETSGLFEVMGVEFTGDPRIFDNQPLEGTQVSLLGDLPPGSDVQDGFQYIRTRDGTLLSVMVRFPDTAVYGDGPYPTVMEYSGYSPSNPEHADSGSLIANALGFATVGVNMRGTGCSGGVFDVFNRAQHADGYDAVEVIARQDWALNNKIGMVGLSYPGISQLFVASTAPPSLAAVVPLSTIADPWQMQWPGGVYNKGFTAQWLDQRESQAEVNGISWVVAQIELGDSLCEGNVQLSTQNVDFEPFFHGLEFRPRDADDRDLNQLVEQIDAPVFLGGAFQDEQTGALFGSMLDRFYGSPNSKFMLYNGRHADGYGPEVVYRWYEFLEFYVAGRIPRLNAAMRLFGGDEFGAAYGVDGLGFEEDRFTQFADDEYASALALYQAESPVRVLFEVGAGHEVPKAPVSVFHAEFDVWPPLESDPVQWSLDANGTLVEGSASVLGVDRWRFDAEAGDHTFFGPTGYQTMALNWDIDWTNFAEGDQVSYVTAPFEQIAVLTGPGIANLWVRSPVDDVTVQVTLTEIRPDGNELLLQSGWLRLGHGGAEDAGALRLTRSFGKADYHPLPLNEWVEVQVEIPSLAHAMRPGSSLRMAVSTPGRNHGTWEFESPEYDSVPTFEVGRGGAHASTLTLATLPGLDVPTEGPDCGSYRGQPCRVYVPVTNVVGAE